MHAAYINFHPLYKLQPERSRRCFFAMNVRRSARSCITLLGKPLHTDTRIYLRETGKYAANRYTLLTSAC